MTQAHASGSIAGKKLDIAGHAELLVVGAGKAGLAAAIEAARNGLQVTLVDENPVAFETMGESVPQLYGQRMTGAVRNRNAMMEAMLRASPEIETALELGVDVRLGAACWGLYLNTGNLGWLEKPVAGLADDTEGTMLISFDHAIVATGRRDMGLAFPGWDQPGVMGATAAATLSRLYGALDGRRAVVLGTTAEALLAALELADAGIEIACVVEQADAPVAPAALVARLQERDIDIRFGEVVRAVETDADGVRGVELSVGPVICDLVVLGIGAVPMIDLIASAGARLVFDDRCGGFVPVLDAAMTTSFPNVKAVGDCAGIWPEKSIDPEIAAAEGRHAAASLAGKAARAWAPPAGASYDLGAYRKDWVRSSVVEAAGEPYVCQCEEVSAREILEVTPPRYLGWRAKANQPRSLSDILGGGPPEPDQIKRLTRAGMGPCQGRRCREQVQALLALQENLPLDAIPLAGYRAPVRPLPLKAAIPATEDPAITALWDSWLGIPRQWVPFWDVEDTYTVASLATEKDYVSE